MANLVTARIMWAWFLLVAAAEGIDAILGFPMSPWIVLLGCVAIPSAVHLAGDRWRQGAGQRNQVIQEDYEARHAARINGERVFTEWELRESLDEAGQAAFDLLTDAVERRDAAQDPGVATN